MKVNYKNMYLTDTALPLKNKILCIKSKELGEKVKYMDSVSTLFLNSNDRKN